MANTLSSFRLGLGRAQRPGLAFRVIGFMVGSSRDPFKAYP